MGQGRGHEAATHREGAGGQGGDLRECGISDGLGAACHGGRQALPAGAAGAGGGRRHRHHGGGPAAHGGEAGAPDRQQAARPGKLSPEQTTEAICRLVGGPADLAEKVQPRPPRCCATAAPVPEALSGRGCRRLVRALAELAVTIDRTGMIVPRPAPGWPGRSRTAHPGSQAARPHARPIRKDASTARRSLRSRRTPIRRLWNLPPGDR